MSRRDSDYFEDITEKSLRVHVVESLPVASLRRGKQYLPHSIRVPFLLGFCVLTLGIFSLLQLSGASAQLALEGKDGLFKRSAPSYVNEEYSSTTLGATVSGSPLTSAIRIYSVPSSTTLGDCAATETALLDGEGLYPDGSMPSNCSVTLGSADKAAYVDTEYGSDESPFEKSSSRTSTRPSSTSEVAPASDTSIENERYSPTPKPVTVTGSPAAGAYTSNDGEGETSPASDTYSKDSSKGVDSVPDDFSGFGGFSTLHYFLGAYLPVLVAVIYGIIWKIIFAGIAEMMPFFQLNNPNGATMDKSLSLRYQNSTLVHVFFSSIKNRHGIVLSGALVSMIATLITAIAPGVMYIGTVGSCDATGDGDDCIPYLALRRPLAWLEGGLLFIIFAIMIYIILSIRKKSSGIFAEATSIAGAAVLLQNPYFVDRLRSSALGDKTAFKRTKYGMGHYVDQYAHEASYGINVVAEPREAVFLLPIGSSQQTQKPAKNKPPTVFLLRLFPLLAFLSFLLGTLVLVLYYRLVHAESGFETFMDSQGAGVKYFMTSIGILIRMFWSSVERDIRALEPWRRLARGKATAHESILVPSSAHPIIGIFASMYRRHYFVSYVALLATLSEVLVVTLASVPFKGGLTYPASNVSAFVSAGIVFVMVLTVPVLMVRYRGGVLQAPGSLTATMGYFSAGSSEVLRSFGGLSILSKKERDAKIVSLRRTYGLEKTGGRDYAALNIRFGQGVSSA